LHRGGAAVPPTVKQEELIEDLLGRVGWSLQFALLQAGIPGRTGGENRSLRDLEVEEASELIDLLLEESRPEW
jgi:hypothetical protein